MGPDRRADQGVSAPAAFGSDWSAGRRRGTDAELRGWLEVAQAACDAADITARAHFRRDLTIETKPDRSFVTQADTAIERMIRERLLDAFPDHGLVGEEYGIEAGDASVRWYIDPIDGTHNFIRGVPLFGTLLAVERDGELQAGVMSAPALDERWWAWRGGGAWARNRGEPTRRIHVSRVSSLDDAQVLYGSGQDIIASGRVPGFEGLLRDVWRERGFGDFWGYALVAEGAAEAMVEVGLSAWDAAAPSILIEEAGGSATDLEGRRAIDSGTFLTTNGLLHDIVRDRLVGG
jgi:histidinol-phosphatase